MLARSVAQHRAFLELARVVASGPHGIWTGALPVLLSPAEAAWGVVYRVAGNGLELFASEGLPLALRPHVEALDLLRHGGFAACRAVRTRRTVSEERIFAGATDGRIAAGFEAAGLASGAAVPIAHGGTVFGVLVVGGGARELDADTVTFLDAAASLLAPALALAEGARGGALADRRSPGAARAPSGRSREGKEEREAREGREASRAARGSSSNPPRGSSSHPPRGSSSNPPRGSSSHPPRGSSSHPPRGASTGAGAASSPPPAPSSPPPAPSVDAGRAAVEAVQQCMAFLRRTGIDVRVAVEEGHVAAGEASDIGLAIAHLVTNAAEATAELAPSALQPSRPRRVRVAVAREGATILVSVDDSGRGVPPDLRARVFEPGFSTKGKKRGSGLAVVRKIALASGGHVEVGASDLGGASFRMVLPAVAVPAERASSGLWHTGATWPQMHVPVHEGTDADHGEHGRGERGGRRRRGGQGEPEGEGGEGDPAVVPFRRASSG